MTTVTLNLTPIIITAIICLTLIILGSMGKKGKEQKRVEQKGAERKEIQVPDFVNRGHQKDQAEGLRRALGKDAKRREN